MSRTAFVTGGTGFVGLNLVQRLMARDWDVIALHRPTSDLKFLNRFRPRLAIGSITDQESLHAALPDVKHGLGGISLPEDHFLRSIFHAGEAGPQRRAE